MPSEQALKNFRPPSVLKNVNVLYCVLPFIIRGHINLRKGRFFFSINIYLATTLLMTILTFTWRKNKNKVQEIKEKYNVTAFTTN